ncbi:PAS domain S-box protein [Burkholderia sp. Tr-20390]|uniref:PAS domain S-box protein n=1 Tax=Burkholderia sp. Tr-20390 TaxID=2703904 RepID=UPI00197DC2A8|nr:PAS domain S-box protein [Burkholderia sp. Tr-20390]MBN3733180.1 PAS domain S-box protein [Burkholderia sp. Tr-20390]
MNGKRAAFQELDDYLGTTSPIWKFSGGSDELVLSKEGGTIEPNLPVRVSARQAEEIRRLTGVTAVLILDVQIFGKKVELHLVGKKINAVEWAGVAAVLRDSQAVAKNSMQAIAFAEQVVSEVNSILVVLDRDGTIRRFNRMAEEHTGYKEENVIGENAQELFMSADEGQSSRSNIARFFEQGRPQDVERVIETRTGPRPFLFRNRFIMAEQSAEPEFIVCSGVELVKPIDDVPARRDDYPPSLSESYALDVMHRIMDWASMVDGARTLLAAFEDGSGDPRTLAHAKRLAASAVRDAYGLYEEIDSRLSQRARQS